MSAQHDRPARTGGTRPSGTPWRVRDDGTTVFRMQMPLVGWWAWVAFAVLTLGDLGVQGRDRAALQAAVAVVAITGILYACTLRPRVVADRDGITVHNPVRDHRIPWGAVTGIDLGDSVEFSCARPEQKDKTIYSWALYTRRRARLKAQMRPRVLGGQSGRDRLGQTGGSGGYGRMPSEARELSDTAIAEIIARELQAACRGHQARCGRRHGHEHLGLAVGGRDRRSRPGLRAGRADQVAPALT